MKGCNFNNLGFLSPYHFVDDAGFKTFDKFDELVSARQSEEIDPVSILEYLNRRYFLADRTLLRNVRKSAWMTSVNDELPRRLAALPDHGGLETGPELIAAGLTARLRQELLDACSGTRRILLPLSGGMDSRVIAAVLWDLKRTGELSADIDTITWGVDTSRDVIYGQQLATLLKWNWQHLRLTPDVLANNLDVVVGLGCEFAGLHLHAKTALRNLRGYDLVLVASFGDSVGRAMYSGLHVSRLDSLLKVGNPFSLLRQGVYSRILAAAMDDARYYHSLFPRTEAWQANEIDQQAHYMYRMLNPAWAYVNERIPVYQCFGAPSVFGYMWSFSPVSRNDIPYYHLIHTINKELLMVPWAKTGGSYPHGPQTDNYLSLLAPYGQWTREDLAEMIAEHLFDGVLDSMGIFNMRNIKTIFTYMKKGSFVASTHVSEILLWLTSLSKAVRAYSLTVDQQYTRYTFKDLYSELISTPVYSARLFYGPNLKLAYQNLVGNLRH